MELNKLYEMIEKMGVLTFSTLSKTGEVHSRVAHFNGFDEQGLYFRTMVTKPYYRQLMETKQLTVCGMSNQEILGHTEDGTPIFPPSYSIRIIGDIKNIPFAEIEERAKNNEGLKTAVQDGYKYPTMKDANFVIYRAKVEIFDVDFEKSYRDHKLIRTRFSFGDVKYNLAGPRITDSCIGCDLCRKTCTFDAIEVGSPYKVNPNYCDDCGMCLHVCPVNAIKESLEF